MRELIQRAIAIVEAEREVLFSGHQVNGVVTVDDAVDQEAADAINDMDAWLTEARAAIQAPQEAGESLHEAEARILQEYKWGNLTKLGVANHLRRAGFKHKVAVDKANALSQPEAQAVPEGWKPTHRHVKTGGEYTLLGIGRMQSEMWLEQKDGDIDRPSSFEPIDMREVAIYRGADGNLWVRPIEEFDDGRFASLAAPPATGGA